MKHGSISYTTPNTCVGTQLEEQVPIGKHKMSKIVCVCLCACVCVYGQYSVCTHV